MRVLRLGLLRPVSACGGGVRRRRRTRSPRQEGVRARRRTLGSPRRVSRRRRASGRRAAARAARGDRPRSRAGHVPRLVRRHLRRAGIDGPQPRVRGAHRLRRDGRLRTTSPSCGGSTSTTFLRARSSRSGGSRASWTTCLVAGRGEACLALIVPLSARPREASLAPTEMAAKTPKGRHCRPFGRGGGGGSLEKTSCKYAPPAYASGRRPRIARE